jgi:murein DD-endopeptidase MepM/ murein hydrolase activator NlpD
LPAYFFIWNDSIIMRYFKRGILSVHKNIIARLFLFLLIIGYLVPEKLIIPVECASRKDWNKDSFWHYPWGKSVTHKGVDIFAKNKTKVLAPSSGILIAKGYGAIAGNYIYMLGPHWHIYYFCHLDSISSNPFLVKQGQVIGFVGNSGNAAFKQPHLHFSIATIIPYIWKLDLFDKQGWLKMFYLDPNNYLL